MVNKNSLIKTLKNIKDRLSKSEKIPEEELDRIAKMPAGNIMDRYLKSWEKYDVAVGEDLLTESSNLDFLEDLLIESMDENPPGDGSFSNEQINDFINHFEGRSLRHPGAARRLQNRTMQYIAPHMDKEQIADAIEKLDGSSFLHDIKDHQNKRFAFYHLLGKPSEIYNEESEFIIGFIQNHDLSDVERQKVIQSYNKIPRPDKSLLINSLNPTFPEIVNHGDSDLKYQYISKNLNSDGSLKDESLKPYLQDLSKKDIVGLSNHSLSGSRFSVNYMKQNGLSLLDLTEGSKSLKKLNLPDNFIKNAPIKNGEFERTVQSLGGDSIDVSKSYALVKNETVNTEEKKQFVLNTLQKDYQNTTKTARKVSRGVLDPDTLNESLDSEFLDKVVDLVKDKPRGYQILKPLSKRENLSTESIDKIVNSDSFKPDLNEHFMYHKNTSDAAFQKMYEHESDDINHLDVKHGTHKHRVLRDYIEEKGQSIHKKEAIKQGFDLKSMGLEDKLDSRGYLTADAVKQKIKEIPNTYYSHHDEDYGDSETPEGVDEDDWDNYDEDAFWRAVEEESDNVISSYDERDYISDVEDEIWGDADGEVIEEYKKYYMSQLEPSLPEDDKEEMFNEEFEDSPKQYWTEFLSEAVTQGHDNKTVSSLVSEIEEGYNDEVSDRARDSVTRPTDYNVRKHLISDDSWSKDQYENSMDSGEQRHTPENSNVFVLNTHPYKLREMAKEGLYDDFVSILEDSDMGGHPGEADKHSVGWIRYTGDEDGIHGDEIQSDFYKELLDQHKTAMQNGDTDKAEKIKKINEHVFGGRHPSQVLLDSFVQKLRGDGLHDTPIHTWHWQSKAPISGHKLPKKTMEDEDGNEFPVSLLSFKELNDKQKETALEQVDLMVSNSPRVYNHLIHKGFIKDGEDGVLDINHQNIDEVMDHIKDYTSGSHFYVNKKTKELVRDNDSHVGLATGRKITGDMRSAYEQTPKKMGFSPGKYGELETQHNPFLQEGHVANTVGIKHPEGNNKTWKDKVRKSKFVTLEEFILKKAEKLKIESLYKAHKNKDLNEKQDQSFGRDPLDKDKHGHSFWGVHHPELYDELNAHRNLDPVARQKNTSKYMQVAGFDGKEAKSVIKAPLDWKDLKLNHTQENPDVFSHFLNRNFGTSHRDAAFHYLSRHIFGMDHFVPQTTVFKHPKTGSDWSAQAWVHGATGLTHSDQLKSTSKEDLQKLAIMETILGHNDRNSSNIVFDKSNQMKLIDNALSFDYSHRYGNPVPKYAKDIMHDDIEHGVHDWLDRLDSHDMAQKMSEMGAPTAIINKATDRMHEMKSWSKAIKNNKNYAQHLAGGLSLGQAHRLISKQDKTLNQDQLLDTAWNQVMSRSTPMQDSEPEDSTVVV